MTHGITEVCIPLKEIPTEIFLCKHNRSSHIFKHDRFYLSRDLLTGIIVAQCARCYAVYEIQDGEKKE